ncbi:hypothetical protein CBM2637_B110322 [Cupriavidus taiwanensis]|nr:hypothetical protein CBM2637_B110322 [Cupriavidus taiwanensis]
MCRTRVKCIPVAVVQLRKKSRGVTELFFIETFDVDYRPILSKELCATAQHCHFHALDVDFHDLYPLLEFEAIKRNNVDISASNRHGLGTKVIGPQLLEAPIAPYFAQRT